MATITPTVTSNTRGVITYTWLMGDADTGVAIRSPHLADKDLQVVGTAWDSATLVIEGSNDGGTTYRTLKPVNTDNVTTLSFTSGNPSETILNNPDLIRPRTTGGAGSADIKVYITMKK